MILFTKVRAEDKDRGDNGRITYHIVTSNDQSHDRFSIDPETGILRTEDMFDREAVSGGADYGVTIKAQDQGSPSLAGFCTFKVKIADVNDNPPVFDFSRYSTSLEESSIIGKKVIQVQVVCILQLSTVVFASINFETTSSLLLFKFYIFFKL